MADQSTVRAPFDDADANIIVRSSDGVDFRLYKNVLAKASPVFRDMFTLPASSSSSSESPEDPQTISLSENAETLDALFRLCYPVEHPVFTAFEHVRAVLEAAEKYDMTSLVGNLEEYFVPFLDSEPLRTYATGYFLQSREIARAAAKRLLEDPEFAAPDVPPPEFDSLPALALHSVFIYRKECVAAAIAATKDDMQQWMIRGEGKHSQAIQSVMDLSRSWIWLSCPNSSNLGAPVRARMTGTRSSDFQEFRTQEWWSKYIVGVQNELALRPVGHVVTAQKNVEPFVNMALKCWTCAPRAWADMTKFTQLLAKEIDEAVSKVEIRLPF